MKTKLVMIGLLLFSFAGFSHAQCATKKGIRGTQINQQKRIQKGALNGKLNKYEYVGLQKQQKNINLTVKKAKSDGFVEPRERAIIRSKQAAASKNIYIQKHD